MSNQIENYFKINLLLNKLTKEILNKFLIKWNRIFNYEWENSEQFGKRLNEIINQDHDVSRSLTKPQKDAILKGDSNSWDISLLYRIFSCNKFYDNIFRDDIQEIKEIRNKLYHNPLLEISDTEYESFFSILKRKLEDFNPNRLETTEILDYIKSAEIKFLDTKNNNQKNISTDMKLDVNPNKNFNMEIFLTKKEVYFFLLTYLKVIRIFRFFSVLSKVKPAKTKKNRHHGFPANSRNKIFQNSKRPIKYKEPVIQNFLTPLFCKFWKKIMATPTQNIYCSKPSELH